MKFTAKTDEEIKSEDKYAPFEAGEYFFEVLEAEDAVSSNGNDMIKINIKVFDNGTERTTRIYDYLLEAMLFKVKHFCDSTGLTKQYEAGELSSDLLVGQTGKVQLIIDTYKKDGEEKTTNKVKDYVVSEAPKTLDETLSDDNVPF